MRGWKEMREGEIIHLYFPSRCTFCNTFGKKESKCSNCRNINWIYKVNRLVVFEERFQEV